MGISQTRLPQAHLANGGELPGGASIVSLKGTLPENWQMRQRKPAEVDISAASWERPRDQNAGGS